MIPGSHRWSDSQVAGFLDRYNTDAQINTATDRQLVSMVVPASACIVFHGTLLHRGGANKTDAPRLAFSNQYCQPWARTQENFFLGLPPQLVRGMSWQLQTLLGYDIMPPFMGHVTASHPSKTLKSDYVYAVLARRSLGWEQFFGGRDCSGRVFEDSAKQLANLKRLLPESSISFSR